MSLCDARNLRLVGLAAGLCALLALSGCQVKPLYATDTNTQQAMAAIDFSEADDRVELEVRNNLVFLASGGAGEPVNPQYDVDFNVTTRYVGVLLDLKDDLPRAGRVELRAEFTLKRRGTEEILRTGKRRTVALVDYPGQEFAKIRATRDAENRAAREMAELIRADLAAWLGR
ncbi:LPS assembly lipoprotein LptE [Rhizobium sp.]